MLERNARLPIVALLCAACASSEVDPSADREQARALIRESTGQAEVFDPEAPPLSPGEIEALLGDGLGLDEALRLALLNTRRLQAGFLGLGVARADYVQAGLLRNPSLGISFLAPSGGGRWKLSADLVQSLVDLWELPARQEVAERALHQDILELSRFAGELVVDTKRAYLESVGAGERLAAARENAEVAQAAYEAERRRVEGGVATAVDANLSQSQALGSELALRSAEREGYAARRRLAALLSLEDDLQEVALTDPLPEPSADGSDREALVALSRSARLDLSAAAAAVEAAEKQLDLERSRAFPDVGAGVSVERPERDASVDVLFGPAATVELPIFDRNTAQVRRAEFRSDQLREEYEALVVETSQDVRAQADRAASAARAARFVVDELLPQAERGLELAQASYDLGDTTLLAVLESRRALLRARSTRVEAVLEAAHSRIELERAVGSPLGTPPGP